MIDRAHGWRLVPNWDSYGVYGWGLGVSYMRTPVADGMVERVVLVQVGPWKAMWEKVHRGD